MRTSLLVLFFDAVSPTCFTVCNRIYETVSNMEPRMYAMLQVIDGKLDVLLRDAHGPPPSLPPVPPIAPSLPMLPPSPPPPAEQSFTTIFDYELAFIIIVIFICISILCKRQEHNHELI